MGMAYSNSFGYWVRRRRMALDLTQRKLADCASCSPATIRKIEADERRPSHELAILLAGCLGVAESESALFLQAARGQKQVAYLPLTETPLAVENASNLPAATMTFFGRLAELETLRGFLDDDHHRLITIVGQGGIGKTQLALEAARSRLYVTADTQTGAGGNLHQDGVWLVPLDGIDDIDYLPGAIADALNLQFVGPATPVQQLVNHLSDWQALLIFDNFEQLLPDGAALLVDLLRQCPRLKLLITSRERLNVRAESTLILSGLSAAAGVDLFIRRAQQINPAGVLGQETAAFRIWELVGGLPLGLELTAAWTRLLSAEQIVTELQHGLDLLTATHQDVADRHRNIRTVFNASWQRLTAEEQQVLAQLSVFRGPFTLGSAMGVAETTLPILLNLVDHSLLQRQGDLLTLHELIRQLVAEKLKAQPMHRQHTQERHFSTYLSRLTLLSDHFMHGGRSDLDCLADMDQELDNYRKCWQWAIDNCQAQQLMPAIHAFYLFYDIRGRIVEGLAFFRKALDSVGSIGDDQLDEPISSEAAPPAREEARRCQAALLIRSALLYVRYGQYDLAEEMALKGLTLLDSVYPGTQQVVTVSNDIDDEQAAALMVLSSIDLLQGKLMGAIAKIESAKETFQKSKNYWGFGVSLTQLAFITAFTGDQEEFGKILRDAEKNWRGIESVHGVARNLMHQSLISPPREAVRQLHEAMEMAEKVHEIAFIPYALNSLAAAHLKLGELTAVHEALARSLHLSQRHQLLQYLINTIRGYGVLAWAQGEPETAVTLLTFSFNHPAAPPPIVWQQAQELLDQLEKKLSQLAFQAARREGMGVELEHVLGFLPAPRDL